MDAIFSIECEVNENMVKITLILQLNGEKTSKGFIVEGAVHFEDIP